MAANLKCANCSEYLFLQPMQCPCGDRLCGSCFEAYKASKTKVICPLCQADIVLEDCFRDRAATMELRKATLQCNSPGCSWQGPSDKYQEHMQTSKFTTTQCQKNVCKEELTSAEMENCAVRDECQPVHCTSRNLKLQYPDISLKQQSKEMERPSSISNSGRLSVSSQIVTTHQVEQRQVTQALSLPKKWTHQRSLKPVRPNSVTARKRRSLSTNDEENTVLSPDNQESNQKQKLKLPCPRRRHHRSHSACIPVMMKQPSEATRIDHSSNGVTPIVSMETTSNASQCSELVASHMTRLSGLENQSEAVEICVGVSSQWLQEIDIGSLVVGRR